MVAARRERISTALNSLRRRRTVKYSTEAAWFRPLPDIRSTYGMESLRREIRDHA
jgi:hypothetical protein